MAVAVGLATATPTSAVAQPATAPPGPAIRASMLLVIRAPTEEEAPLIDVLTDAARRRDLSITFDARASSVLRVEIDASSPVPSVLVIDLRDDAVLTRRQVPRVASGEVLREELALVVASAIDAARARTPSPRPTPPVAPPVSVERRAPTERTAGATTSFVGAPFVELRKPGADVNTIPGVGVGARASFDTTLRPSVSLMAGWRSPAGVDGDKADLRLTSAVVRALAGVRVADGERLSLAVFAGPTLSIDHVAARSRSPDVQPRPGQTLWVPMGTALLGGGLKLGQGNALELQAGVDAPLGRRRAVVATPSGPSTLYAPSSVQPVVMLTLLFSIGGAP